MIKVKLDNVNVTGSEKQIAQLLIKSIKKDVSGLKCAYCHQDSEVILHVDNSKMSVLRTEIRSCCHQFAEVIENNLYEVEHA